MSQTFSDLPLPPSIVGDVSHFRLLANITCQAIENVKPVDAQSRIKCVEKVIPADENIQHISTLNSESHGTSANPSLINTDFHESRSAVGGNHLSPHVSLKPMTHKHAGIQWWSSPFAKKYPQEPCPPERSDFKYADEEFYINADKANDVMGGPPVGVPTYPFVKPGITAEFPISLMMVKKTMM